VLSHRESRYPPGIRRVLEIDFIETLFFWVLVWNIRNYTFPLADAKRAMEALLVEVFDDLATRFILTCPVEEFSSFERLFFQIEAAHWCVP